MKKHWKLIVPILLALAITLGLLQRDELKDLVGAKKSITKFDSPSADSLEGYYKKGQVLAESAGEKNEVTFLAVGDIMLSRNVAGTIQKANDSLLPFKSFADVLKSTDFNFANLESPISGSSYFNSTGSLVFNAPTEYTAGLSEYNFKILNLANNHAFDQGLKGLEYTNEFLDGLNIKHIGTGKDLAEAWKPEIVEANGIRIGFVGASYSSINDGGKATNNYVARIEDLKNLKSSISNLKSRADFIVVTMHAGTEYTHKPNQGQIDFAHAAIDYGADIVIGAHPHWIQTIERYCPANTTSNSPSPRIGEGAGGEVDKKSTCANPKYIFYSLGNFIFDQEWSQETKEGLTLKIQVSKTQDTNLQGPKIPAQIDSIELIPVIIENYSTPRPATADETKRILQKIDITSTILK